MNPLRLNSSISPGIGYFDVKSRLISCIKRVAKDLAPAVLVGIILLGVLLGQHIGSTDAFKLAAIIVSNTVYELVLMILLGYGLVEFPRAVWRHSDLERHLRLVQMKAANDFKDISDAQFEVGLVIASVMKTRAQLPKHVTDKVQRAMDILVAGIHMSRNITINMKLSSQLNCESSRSSDFSSNA